jgi:hypothetical protein
LQQNCAKDGASTVLVVPTKSEPGPPAVDYRGLITVFDKSILTVMNRDEFRMVGKQEVIRDFNRRAILSAVEKSLVHSLTRESAFLQ